MTKPTVKQWERLETAAERCIAGHLVTAMQQHCKNITSDELKAICRELDSISDDR